MIKLLLQAMLIILSIVFYAFEMIEQAIYIAILSISLNVLNQTKGGEE